MSCIKIPHILLPQQDTDMTKWSVIACDQFTSQPKYWEELSMFVGDAPSTLNLIYPEVYLDEDEEDAEARIEQIYERMRAAFNGGLFRCVDNFVLVDRTQSDGKHRLGLMIAVDLEDYDYTSANNALIKATEKTVVERLPARISVRKGACLELPHVMVLMDDRENEILPDLYARKDTYTRLYDFDLNMGGGHLAGYAIEDSDAVLATLEDKLLSPEKMARKYGADRRILFAVGDGNHSLATAKECWNKIKLALSPQEQHRHPARYALCELVNLHDNALSFEPIHRVITGADEELIDWLQSKSSGDSVTKLIWNERVYELAVSSSPSDAIADLQSALDTYCKAHKDVEIDYIHGDDNLMEVARKKNAMALFMPTIAKDSLFDYVARRGVLPRKSFSMGNAQDKRYYCEAKKIKW